MKYGQYLTIFYISEQKSSNFFLSKLTEKFAFCILFNGIVHLFKILFHRTFHLLYLIYRIFLLFYLIQQNIFLLLLSYLAEHFSFFILVNRLFHLLSYLTEYFALYILFYRIACLFLLIYHHFSPIYCKRTFNFFIKIVNFLSYLAEYLSF